MEWRDTRKMNDLNHLERRPLKTTPAASRRSCIVAGQQEKSRMGRDIKSLGYFSRVLVCTIYFYLKSKFRSFSEEEEASRML